jgi:hypothetical protein
VPSRQAHAVEPRRLALAHGQDHRDRIGDETAEREEQGIRARPVQPVRVVHQHDDRGLFSVGGQQAECPRPHGEAARRAGRPEGERAPQCLGLRAGDPVDPGQRRPEEFKQAGERDLGLRLHPAGPEHAHAGRLLPGVGEQGRLADPDLPDDGEHTAAARAGLVEQTDERPLLPVTADQHKPSVRSHPVRSHAPEVRTRGLPGSEGTRVPPTFRIRNSAARSGHSQRAQKKERDR